jgi:hypothetical protein
MRHLASVLVVVLVSSLGVSACGSSVAHGTGASGTGGTGTTGTTTTGTTTTGTTTMTGTTSTATTGTTTGTTITTGTTTTTTAGECTSDAQCGSGHCVALTPGGYKVCTRTPPEATACTPSVLDQCCTSADCTGGGKCYAVLNLPSCGGGPPLQPHNECATDQCTDDASCTGSGGVPMICLPAGVYGNPARSCFTAYCHTGADCTAQGAGACLPVTQPCCSAPAGLGCVYTGGCANGNVCGSGYTCELDPATGTGRCGPISICPP